MRRFQVPLPPASRRWGLCVLVAVTLVWSSLTRPGIQPPRLGPFGFVGMDKWIHAFAYCGFTLAVAFALVDREQGPTRMVAMAVATAVVFGAGIELLQGQLSYRTFSLFDALANGVGAAAGGLSWSVATQFVRFDSREPSTEDAPTNSS